MDTQRQKLILVLVTDTPESIWGRMDEAQTGNRNVFWTPGDLFERSFAEWIRDGLLQIEETVVLTDSPAAALFCKQNRIACAGYQKEKESGFFPDVSLVFEEKSPLDMEELDRLRRRTYGLPVTVMQTERLLLREMRSKDFEFWKEAWKGDIRDTGLSEMAAYDAYIHTAYAFYGYGYWTVQHKSRIQADVPMQEKNDRRTGFPMQEKRDRGKNIPLQEKNDRRTGPEEAPVIGFCGFRPYEPEKTSRNPPEENRCTLWLYKQEEEPFSEKKNMPETGTETRPEDMEKEEEILELGYVLLPAWRGAGLGMQMCRAAISYAWSELGISAVVCRIRKDNRKSLALAARLGFHPAQPGVT